MYAKSEGKIEINMGTNQNSAFPRFSSASKRIVFTNENLTDKDSSTILPSEVSIPDIHLPKSNLIRTLGENRSYLTEFIIKVLKKSFYPHEPSSMFINELTPTSTRINEYQLNKIRSMNLLEKPSPDPEFIEYIASMPPKRSRKVKAIVRSRKKGTPNPSRSEILIDE